MLQQNTAYMGFTTPGTPYTTTFSLILGSQQSGSPYNVLSQRPAAYPDRRVLNRFLFITSHGSATLTIQYMLLTLSKSRSWGCSEAALKGYKRWQSFLHIFQVLSSVPRHLLHYGSSSISALQLILSSLALYDACGRSPLCWWQVETGTGRVGRSCSYLSPDVNRHLVISNTGVSAMQLAVVSETKAIIFDKVYVLCEYSTPWCLLYAVRQIPCRRTDIRRGPLRSICPRGPFAL